MHPAAANEPKCPASVKKFELASSEFQVRRGQREAGGSIYRSLGMNRVSFQKFAADEEGATAIEYALIAAMIAVAIVSSSHPGRQCTAE